MNIVKNVWVVSVLLAAAAVGAMTTLGCENAVGLDVKYNDAGTDTSAPPNGNGGGDDAGGVVDPDATTPEPTPVTHNELEACPCDTTQGLACCVSAVGPAFCTTDESRCQTEQGGFYRCFAGDPSSESACCWTGSGAGATTSLTSECKDRPTACLEDKHCPSGAAGSCHLRTCAGVTYGACDRDAPECPPGTAQ